MDIFNFKKSEKILILTFTILFIILLVSSIYDIFKAFDILTLISLIIFTVASIILPIITLIAFSSKTILKENGIVYKTIFKSSFHSWDDVNFAAEYEITLRYTPINGIICSFDLAKDEIKYSHFVKWINPKHCLCFPYSEETKDYLIDNLPYGKYLGLTFTDESLNKK